MGGFTHSSCFACVLIGCYTDGVQLGADLPKLTVIIPTYNYGQYLTNAIESALVLPFATEIIVIDDGSTDNTSEIIAQLSSQHTNIIYICQENAGPGVARNQGLARASADFVVFLDADDQLLPEGVADVVAYLDGHPNVDVLVSAHLSQDPRGRTKLHLPGSVSEFKEENFKSYLIDKQLTMSNGSVFMRMSAIPDYRFPAIRNSEDVPFFARLLAHLNTVSTGEETALIKKHPGSLRHNTDHAAAISDTLAAEIFEDPELPEWAAKYERRYYANRCLSLFRTFYKARMYSKALEFYGRALDRYPSSVLKPKLIKKALVAWLRRTVQTGSQ